MKEFVSEFTSITPIKWAQLNDKESVTCIICNAPANHFIAASGGGCAYCEDCRYDDKIPKGYKVAELKATVIRDGWVTLVNRETTK